jgi:hypothetical protein
MRGVQQQDEQHRSEEYDEETEATHRIAKGSKAASCVGSFVDSAIGDRHGNGTS